MPHDDKSRVAGRFATRHGEPPGVEVVSADDGEPDATDDDWNDYAPTADKGVDGFVSTGHDQIFYPDEGFDSLSGLAEADVLATVEPLEFDDEVPTATIIEIDAIRAREPHLQAKTAQNVSHAAHGGCLSIRAGVGNYRHTTV